MILFLKWSKPQKDQLIKQDNKDDNTHKGLQSPISKRLQSLDVITSKPNAPMRIYWNKKKRKIQKSKNLEVFILDWIKEWECIIIIYLDDRLFCHNYSHPSNIRQEPERRQKLQVKRELSALREGKVKLPDSTTHYMMSMKPLLTFSIEKSVISIVIVPCAKQ